MSDTIKAIAMPKWGMEMSEGDISEWHVAIGDQVNEGDDLVDVETSKIVNTVTATDSGILRAIVGNPGETLAVGSLLGVLADADTSDADIQAFIANNATVAVADEAPAAEPASAPAPSASEAPSTSAPNESPNVEATSIAVTSDGMAELAKGEDDSQVSASVVARRLAKTYGVNLNNVSGTGRHGRVSKRDLEAAVTAAGGELIAGPAQTSPAALGDDSQVKATPVARRLASELGVNLLACRASGDRGRVCKADVEAAAALAGGGAVNTAAAGSADIAQPLAAFSETAMTGMRKTIASRLQSSKQTAPHFRVNVDAELDALLAVRAQINSTRSDFKISVNDFIVKACACALLAVPEVNIQFDGNTIKQFSDADISVAVALDDGLITPIVKQANRKGLADISNNVRDLATRAKIGTLAADEFQGGNFCVSNLGMYGIKQFDAIINPPQAAILAVGAGERRPVVRGNELVPATVVSLTLSSDHRVIDGAVAARFMATLKQFIEQPATMLG